MKIKTKMNCNWRPLAAAILVITPVVWGDPSFQFLIIPPNNGILGGGQGTDCPSPFISFVSMTNSSGGVWITPPAGATNGVLTDLTHGTTNYESTVTATCKNTLMTWCNNYSISFPVMSKATYCLKSYILSGSPTNGVVNLQVTWH